MSRENDRPLDPAEVCTLPAPDLAERLAWIRSEILPRVERRERLADGLALELPDEARLVEKLDGWIELERACCGPLSFERTAGSQGRTRLEIRGIDPDSPLVRGLEVPPRAGGAARLGFAAAAGLAGSLFVCCVLPLAAGAVLGAAAAPLAGLDAPLPIAGVALVGAGVAWWWRGRSPAAAGCEGRGC